MRGIFKYSLQSKQTNAKEAMTNYDPLMPNNRNFLFKIVNKLFILFILKKNHFWRSNCFA
jgi:hypothetical protein